MWQPLWEFTPLCFIIAVVCTTMKKDTLPEILEGSLRFFLQIFVGFLVFCLAIYGLETLIR